MREDRGSEHHRVLTELLVQHPLAHPFGLGIARWQDRVYARTILWHERLLCMSNNAKGADHLEPHHPTVDGNITSEVKQVPHDLELRYKGGHGS